MDHHRIPLLEPSERTVARWQGLNPPVLGSTDTVTSTQRESGRSHATVPYEVLYAALCTQTSRIFVRIRFVSFTDPKGNDGCGATHPGSAI